MNATLSITDVPEVLHLLRREMARMLRDVAADEPTAVARRLHEIADAFECGVADGA